MIATNWFAIIFAVKIYDIIQYHNHEYKRTKEEE